MERIQRPLREGIGGLYIAARKGSRPIGPHPFLPSKAVHLDLALMTTTRQERVVERVDIRRAVVWADELGHCLPRRVTTAIWTRKVALEMRTFGRIHACRGLRRDDAGCNTDGSVSIRLIRGMGSGRRRSLGRRKDALVVRLQSLLTPDEPSMFALCIVHGKIWWKLGFSVT